MGSRCLIFLGLVSVGLLWCLTLIIVASARGRKIAKCPHCHSGRIRSSWPRFGDKCLLLTGITAYRCEACLKRFYAMRNKRVLSSVPEMSFLESTLFAALQTYQTHDHQSGSPSANLHQPLARTESPRVTLRLAKYFSRPWP